MKRNENKIKNLKNAILEANRFTEKALLAIARLEEDGRTKYVQYQFKEVASAKRASMDLTRALVNVRKSNQ